MAPLHPNKLRSEISGEEKSSSCTDVFVCFRENRLTDDAFSLFMSHNNAAIFVRERMCELLLHEESFCVSVLQKHLSNVPQLALNL